MYVIKMNDICVKNKTNRVKPCKITTFMFLKFSQLCDILYQRFSRFENNVIRLNFISCIVSVGQFINMIII